MCQCNSRSDLSRSIFTTQSMRLSDRFFARPSSANILANLAYIIYVVLLLCRRTEIIKNPNKSAILRLIAELQIIKSIRSGDSKKQIILLN